MIVVFGPISMELHLPLDKFPDGPDITNAEDYTLNAGGRGSNQAFAAARSGAKVAIVCKTGDDDFSKRILDKIRKDGVITSGVARSDTNHTGMDVYLKAPDGEIRVIKSLAANAETTADQVPEEVLNKDTFVLVQTELPITESLALLQKAKAAGATTVMNLAPLLDLSAPLLDALDYMVVNQREARKLAVKFGIPEDGNMEKVAKALAQAGKLNCLVTLGDQGSVAYETDGTGWRIGALKFAPEEVIDTSGAEDAYCGTFVACLQAGMDIAKAMKRASIAGSLACLKEGSQSSFAYLGDIDEKMGELPDAQKIT